MRAMPALLVLAAALAAAKPALADDRNGAYQSFAPPSCETYLAQRVGRPSTAAAWLQGWLTGYDVAAPDTNSLIAQGGFSQLLSWLDAWCRDNRFRHLADGMAAFAYDAYPRRFKGPPPR